MKETRIKLNMKHKIRAHGSSGPASITYVVMYQSISQFYFPQMVTANTGTLLFFIFLIDKLKRNNNLKSEAILYFTCLI